MKINFQSLLYPSSSSRPNLHQSDSISIIVPNQPDNTLNLSKQLSLTKSKNNIQAMMKDLLETSVTNASKSKEKANNSILYFMDSHKSIDYSQERAPHNSNKYDSFSWTNIKGDLIKTMKEQSGKPKIIPRKDLHETLHKQKMKTVKSRATKEFLETREMERQQEYLYSHKLRNNKKRLTRPNVCEQLYNKHRTNQVQNLIRNRLIKNQLSKECTFHPSIQHKPQHLKTYKPLMDRLEEELSKRKEEEDFIQHHKNIDFGNTNQQMFKPQLRKTGISVKSRVYDFMKDREKEREMTLNSETGSLERKREESRISRTLNRSVEIVKSLEEEYVERLISKLFMSHNKVHISADTISRLQEEEFQIIYPFVLHIEKDGVDFEKDEFHDRFMEFYKKLPVHQKHTLKFLYRKEAQYSTKLNPELSSRTSKMSQKSRRDGDSFISKLQKFV